MKILYCLLIAVALFAAAEAQTCQLEITANDIDLSLWHVHPTGQVTAQQGIWTVFGPSNNSVRQSVNVDIPTRLVSDFPISSSQVIRGSMTGAQNALGTGILHSRLPPDAAHPLLTLVQPTTTGLGFRLALIATTMTLLAAPERSSTVRLPSKRG